MLSGKIADFTNKSKFPFQLLFNLFLINNNPGPADINLIYFFA